LLDYLAWTFQQNDWSIKTLHRMILLSSVYQQASSDRPECRAVDPENQLLWRMRRRRMDMEAMRDSLLAVSGRLDLEQGGRPVDLVGDPAIGRRTVYGLVDRQSLPGLYRSFDFASPDQTAERRPFTTTPQQALFALNSPFITEQAKSVIARADVSSAAEPASRIASIFRVVLQREPRQEELMAANEFLQTAEQHRLNGGASQLSAWEQFAQVLLMSNEFIFVD
jgi:hypothetical protein